MVLQLGGSARQRTRRGAEKKKAALGGFVSNCLFLLVGTE